MNKKTLSFTVGSLIATALTAAPVANADSNPFGIKEITHAAVLAEAKQTDAVKTKEGKCGEGKCGGTKAKAAESASSDKAADKAKEGSCGGKAKEGSCGGKKK